MVIMERWYQYMGTLVVATGIGLASVAMAQDATDPAAQQGTQQNQAQPADPQAAIQPAPDPELAAEVQQLRAEVDALKSQVSQLNSVIEQLQASQSASATPKPAPTPSKTTPAARGKTKATTTAKKTPNPLTPPATSPGGDDQPTPMTVLVFQDGHRTEARNYAIVGQTLWIYTEDDSKKMPLSELDVAATKNANSDRGIVFQVPPTK
jgi:hypothetical protein